MPSAVGRPLGYKVNLPVDLAVDPVRHTVVPTKLPGRLVALDPTGKTVSTAPLDFDVSSSLASMGTASSSASTGDAVVSPQPCTPSAAPPGFFALQQVYATSPKNYATASQDYWLQYGFYPFQMDNARWKLDPQGNPKQQRQFIDCVDGGGSTAHGFKQTINGAGSTMKDPRPVIIGKGNWGKGRDASNNVIANLAFEVSDPSRLVTITGQVPVSANVVSSFKGGQGPDGDAPNLAEYPANEVNGRWECGYSWWSGTYGCDTADYTGNVSLGGPWEYDMADTSLHTMRGETYMEFHCHNSWGAFCGGSFSNYQTKRATTDAPLIAPPPDPPPGVAGPSTGTVTIGGSTLYSGSSNPGVRSITMVVENGNVSCQHAVAMDYHVLLNGTVRDPASGIAYSGPMSAEVSSTGSWYESYAGAPFADRSCGNAGNGGIGLNISGRSTSNSNNSIACAGNGNYYRDHQHVVFSFPGVSCTTTGAGAGITPWATSATFNLNETS